MQPAEWAAYIKRRNSGGRGLNVVVGAGAGCRGGGQDQSAKVCPMSRGNLLICDLRNVFHDRRGL